jgi:hypothetical protein
MDRPKEPPDPGESEYQRNNKFHPPQKKLSNKIENSNNPPSDKNNPRKTYKNDIISPKQAKKKPNTTSNGRNNVEPKGSQQWKITKARTKEEI